MFYFAVVCAVLFLANFNINLFYNPKKSLKQSGQDSIVNISLLNLIQIIIAKNFDFRSFGPSLIEAYGTCFRVNLFGFYDVVFVNDPKKLQKLLLSGDVGHVQKPGVYKRIIPAPFNNGLLSSNADVWSPHRKVISKAFTYKGLMNQVQIFEEQVKRLVFSLENLMESKLNEDGDKYAHPNISPLIHKSTFEAASKIVTGKTSLLSDEDHDEFYASFERAKTIKFGRLIKPPLMLDFLWNLHPNSKESDRLFQNICDIVSKMLRKARNIYNSKDQCNEEEMLGKSIIEIMMESGFNDQEIYTEFVTLVTTGHETVSQSLNILLFLFSKHPELQQNCFKEVEKMFEEANSNNTPEVSIEMLTELKYVERCIKEELRLYPTAPFTGRELKSPLKFDENTQLDVGTYVFHSTWFIHRNQDIYPDPEKFDPDRFLPTNFKHIGVCEYMPFSVGSRNCIAWKSAMLELKIYVAYILYNFEVYSEEDNDVKIDLHNLLPLPDLGVKLRRRH